MYRGDFGDNGFVFFCFLGAFTNVSWWFWW